MKTKKLMVALLALGAYFMGNAQTTFPVSPTLPYNYIQLPVVNNDSYASGLFWGTPSGTSLYGIYRTPGLWGTSGAYQQLKMTWSTGIIIDGGNRWSSTYTLGGTQIQPNGGPVYIGSPSTVSQPTALNIYGNTTIGTTTTNSTLSVNGDLSSTGVTTLGSLTTTAGTVSIYGGLNIGLAGGAALGYGTNYIGFQSLRNVSAGTWSVATDGAHNGGGIMYTTVNGDMIFSPVASNSTGTVAQSLTDAQVAANAMLRVSPTSVFAKQIKVQTSVWADYVLKPEYKLRPLKEVEAYINANSHLPEVPSEADVKANGINVADMNATLLKKVEELTLYMIQQQKEIEKQAELIKNLQGKINQ